ncbi:phosphoribosylglycinamide synthetase [Escherichia coli]|nr:phosphoribosylglycinamide synthetase [Escherichia coli]EFJ87331.1 phosphoribosylformylglycinamidine synthase [Escherichia coli MS 84-1]EFK25391.1 phosphoribosylformylglycinamidine synthase [Escherichia coli MS 187-1]EFK69618.1 phosphoribosylformylglycinamidine synthase [Escherichia coli MS 124-1]EFU36552.1 phosphoribosylformylglycinamidine synthase [Escherichia coli MS 85-1]EGB89234.1 phosphoribosylformylglycinamidine synthase [Escherichia coli MS 117-3]
MATYYIHWRHALLIHDGDFISTQTVSSAHQILYNDARFPPLGTPKA